MNAFNSSWLWPVFYNLCFCVFWSYSFVLANIVTKVGYSSLTNGTFTGFDFKVVFSEPAKYFAKLLQVFVMCFNTDNDVINVNINPVDAIKYIIQKSLKIGR